MIKITFLTFHIDYSIGVNVLSSILQEAGYDVSVIFFKLPAREPISWFKDNPSNMEEINPYGDIIGTNVDVNKWSVDEVNLLVNKINKLSPDLLCISSRSTDKELVIDVLPQIRESCNVTTIAGGFGPTFDPKFYLDFVDYAFIGEAENAILEIASAIEKKVPLSGIDNICYKDNGNIVYNKLRTPDIDLFRYQKIPEETFYIEGNSIFKRNEDNQYIKKHSYSTFIGRGCISTCSYCSAGQWRKIYKKEGINIKKRRNRKVEDIIDELILAKRDGYTFVLFRDEFLCGNINFLKQFFKLYEREVQLPFWAYLIPAQILDHPELLKMAVDAGFVDTEIGFQSGSDRVNREFFTRKIPNKISLDYARLLAEYKVNKKYDFILFNPSETAEDINKTFKLIQNLPKERSYLYFGRLFYFPESPVVEIIKNNQYKQSNFDYYYCIALLYLLCFVMPKSEFEKILVNNELVNSWSKLRSIYKSYLKGHGFEFSVGTHDTPESITTHRYQRIIEKQKYDRIIVWRDESYYKKMSHIFNNISISYIIEDNPSKKNASVFSPSILDTIEDKIPIFICSSRKWEINNRIKRFFPDYKGAVYV